MHSFSVGPGSVRQNPCNPAMIRPTSGSIEGCSAPWNCQRKLASLLLAVARFQPSHVRRCLPPNLSRNSDLSLSTALSTLPTGRVGPNHTHNSSWVTLAGCWGRGVIGSSWRATLVRERGSADSKGQSLEHSPGEGPPEPFCARGPGAPPRSSISPDMGRGSVLNPRSYFGCGCYVGSR